MRKELIFLKFVICSRMELGEEPRVRVAAHIFKDLCYNYRDSITAGIIVAGWDKHRGGQVGRGYRISLLNLKSSTFIRIFFFFF